MTGDMKKSKHFAIGFLIVLSLFVSSVSACACSHHASKAAAQTESCHEHSGKKQSPEVDSTRELRQLDGGSECFCAESAPRLFSKSETIKIEKQTAALPFLRVEIETVSTAISVVNVYFEKPFYLSDSFYNLKSPRAPPTA
jgi:hypothetical protein